MGDLRTPRARPSQLEGTPRGLMSVALTPRHRMTEETMPMVVVSVMPTNQQRSRCPCARWVWVSVVAVIAAFLLGGMVGRYYLPKLTADQQKQIESNSAALETSKAEKTKLTDQISGLKDKLAQVSTGAAGKRLDAETKLSESQAALDKAQAELKTIQETLEKKEAEVKQKDSRISMLQGRLEQAESGHATIGEHKFQWTQRVRIVKTGAEDRVLAIKPPKFSFNFDEHAQPLYQLMNAVKSGDSKWYKEDELEKL